MDVEIFVNNLLRELCIDQRIKDGIFKINDKYHLSILREYTSTKFPPHFVDEYMENVVKESEASELAHDKGWTFKGGYWWEGNNPIARTVDGQLKTLYQIETEKHKERVRRQIEKEREETEKSQKQEPVVKELPSQNNGTPIQPVQQPVQQQIPVVQPQQTTNVPNTFNISSVVSDIKTQVDRNVSNES